MKQDFTSALILAVLASVSNAEIVSNSYWEDNHDFVNAAVGVQVVDGIVFGADAALTQLIQSTWTAVGHQDAAYQENVLRVQAVFSEDTFNQWTPNKNAIYTYDAFLKAVAKFPAFCNEAKDGEFTVEDGCRRELASLFTHMHFVSQGLSELKDANCMYSISVTDCGFKSDGLVSPESSLFYARGPLGLKGDTEYAAFSKAFYEGFDRSTELLNEPDRVSDDAYTGFASALWKHMVGREYGPSMHNVMTGFYEPNSSDLQAGHTAGFGTTMQIVDSTVCGTWNQSQGSMNRVNMFKGYQQDLGLAADSENLYCEYMWDAFSWTGSSNKQMFFGKQWGQEKCQAVGWTTSYNAMERDEYKRCVCSENLGMENENCAQESGNDDPTPGPEPEPSPQPEPEPVGPTPLEELVAMILELRANPHYSDTEFSNTTWQVDETLDYIEEKLFTIEESFREAGYIQ